MIELENILAKCGDFNRHQFLMLSLFCIINLLSSMHYYAQTIITFVPEFWCDDYNLDNMTSIEIDDFYEDTEKLSCTKITNSGSEHCKKWMYFYDFGYRSIISDLNWVCDMAWKSNLGQSMFFIGAAIGTLLFFIISEKIGKLPVLIISNVIAMMGNLLTIFSKTFWTFSISRFIAGLAINTNYHMMLILVSEYIQASKKYPILRCCIGVFYCIGTMLTPWIAVLVGNWKIFLLSISLPMIVVPFFKFCVPESIEWLIANQKFNKAVDSLQWISKINGKTVEDSVFKEFLSKCCERQENNLTIETSGNFFSLLKTSYLRRTISILIIKSMIVTLCYDALSRNIQGFDYQSFIIFSLSALTILPANIIIIFLHPRIGTKGTGAIGFLICGIFTLTVGIIGYLRIYTTENLLSVLAIVGRFGITVAYISGEQQNVELMQAFMNKQGLVIIRMFSFGFTFLSPHILYLQTFYPFLPTLILGSFSFIGFVLSLLLPETQNRIQSNTLENVNEFGKNERFYNFLCFERRKSKSTVKLEDNSKYF